MSDKLKFLGLAMVAIFALGTAAVSSAFAAEGTITAGVSNATVTGSQIGKNVFTIGSTGARKVECSVATTKGTLASAASNVSEVPTYSGCITSPGGGPATVNVSSCSYSFTATTKSSATEGAGSASVVCSAGGQISIVANSTGGSKICEYSISAQAASGSKSWLSKLKGALKAVLKIIHITVTVKVSVGTLAACGASAGNSTSGTLTGEAELSADTSGGAETSLSIS
jgi:hypothetical protein